MFNSIANQEKYHNQYFFLSKLENEVLNISANLLFSNFNIFVGMLLGPTDLFEPSEDIMFSI